MTENQNIEYKESWRDENMKSIAAFANANGGTVFIGKGDNGKTVGLAKTGKLMEDIPNKIRNILGLTMDVGVFDDGGLEYIRIDVHPSSVPISYGGKYYYRSGATTHALSGASLMDFLLRKTGTTWDDTTVDGVSVSDLDKTSFDIFRKNALDSGRMSEADLNVSNAELLEKLDLVKNGQLTRAAILLFHHDPEKWVSGAYTKIGFFEGAEILYMDEIHGSLFEQAEKTIDLMFTKYMKAWISYKKETRVGTYPFPRDAAREAYYNCLIHKLYFSWNPIQIRVYEEQLIMANSCVMPHGWTSETLMKNHSSVQLNPGLARAFYRAGFIESWGRGIEKICNACVAHGIPLPEYSVHPEDILMVLTGLEVPVNISGNKAKDQSPLSVTQVTDKVTEKVADKVDEQERTILNILSKDGNITTTQLAEILDVSRKTISVRVKSLKEKGLLEREGSDRAGRWIVSEKHE